MRRVGLVGFGAIAEYAHLPAWHAFAGVHVSAVADVSPARLDRARELLPHAALYDSPMDLIRRAEIEVVDICTPPSTHVDLLEAACASGIADIVSEKPLVISDEEYARVADARAQSGSRIVSVNNWAYSDLNRQVRFLLQKGAIGVVRRVDLRIGRPDVAQGNPGWLPQWRTNPAYSGGGIMLDHGWHQLYLLLGWMPQSLESVTAITHTRDSRHYPVEDEARIDLQFSEGRGRIELSWVATGRINEGAIQGSEGDIAIHDDRLLVSTSRGEEERVLGDRVSQSSYHPEWFCEIFRRGILDQRRDEADRNFAEAGVLVSVIRAAYESAEAGGEPRTPTFRPYEMSSQVEMGEAALTDVHGDRRGIPA